MKLLTTENAKTVKGEKLGWLTGILYLAPARQSGHQVCPHSDAACRKACLYTAGRGRFESIKHARLRKTRWLFEDRRGFVDQLVKDITALKRRAAREGLQLAIRLNGTSDLPWHTPSFGSIPQRFPEVRFYDYTGSLQRVTEDNLPANYDVTFSRKCDNDRQCMTALRRGVNVAVVFDDIPVDGYYWGHRVFAGDESDLRFLERRKSGEGIIIGLKAKGEAEHDHTGFVIRRKAA